MLYYTDETILEIFKLILSDISKNFYGENYVWGNELSRTVFFFFLYFFFDPRWRALTFGELPVIAPVTSRGQTHTIIQ